MLTWRAAVLAELGLEVASYSHVLNDPTIDVVDICVPHDLHAPMALEAIAAGKHVLLEKPLATDMVEAQKLVHAAEHARTVVMIAENWQHAPVATAAEELIRSGAIGEPFLFSGKNLCYFDDGVSPWRLEESKSGGGVLIDAGSHHGPGENADGRDRRRNRYAGSARMARTEPTRGHARSVGTFHQRCDWDHGILLADVWEGGLYGPGNRSGGNAQPGCSRRCAEVGERHDHRGQGPARQLAGVPGFFEETERFVQSVRTGAHPITSPRNESNTLAALLAVYESLRTGKRTPPPTL